MTTVLVQTMLDDLAALVQAESPSADAAALRACADVLAGIGQARLGQAPDRLDLDGTPALRWQFGSPSAAGGIVVVGHLDTVWPLGTLAEIPFDVADGRVTGPGCFDMKAGLVQGVHALASLDDLDGVTFLVTSDEETGSRHSRACIEDHARGAGAALVLEPSAAGAVKTARKGVSLYTLIVHGRSAHAGLEPENGANALLELAAQALHLDRLARPEAGTTVTPTVASAGTATNVVPEQARMSIDVRAADPAEQQRVDDDLRALTPSIPGTRLQLEGGPNRPPLPESAARALFDRAVAVADTLGLPPLHAISVGGGSDGNFTAGVGTPTLDGLGAVGDGAHARHEWVDATSMVDRTRLFAALVADLRRAPLSP